MCFVDDNVVPLHLLELCELHSEDLKPTHHVLRCADTRDSISPLLIGSEDASDGIRATNQLGEPFLPLRQEIRLGYAQGRTGFLFRENERRQSLADSYTPSKDASPCAKAFDCLLLP